MIYHHDINIRQIREGGSNDDDNDDGDIRVCPNESTSMPIIVNGTECCSLFPPLPQLHWQLQKEKKNMIIILIVVLLILLTQLLVLVYEQNISQLL
jgi:hypothetical protein